MEPDIPPVPPVEVPLLPVPLMEPEVSPIPPMLESDPPVLPAVEPCVDELRELLPRLPRFVVLVFLADELWVPAPCPAVDPDVPAVPDPDIVDWSADPFDEPDDWAMAAAGISAAIATPRRYFRMTYFP